MDFGFCGGPGTNSLWILRDNGIEKVGAQGWEK